MERAIKHKHQKGRYASLPTKDAALLVGNGRWSYAKAWEAKMATTNDARLRRTFKEARDLEECKYMLVLLVIYAAAIAFMIWSAPAKASGKFEAENSVRVSANLYPVPSGDQGSPLHAQMQERVA